MLRILTQRKLDACHCLALKPLPFSPFPHILESSTSALALIRIAAASWATLRMLFRGQTRSMQSARRASAAARALPLSLSGCEDGLFVRCPIPHCGYGWPKKICLGNACTIFSFLYWPVVVKLVELDHLHPMFCDDMFFIMGETGKAKINVVK